MLSLADRYTRAHRSLCDVDQDHLLDHYDKLEDDQRNDLLEQIESVDWPAVGRMVKTHVRSKPVVKLPSNIEPAPWYPNIPTKALRDKYCQADQLGRQLVSDGKVAVFTVAGGQGTRLGWNGPKGGFPATPIRQTPLFGCFAEFIGKVQEKYSCRMLWYIMTSTMNHEDTRAVFERHEYFGLKPDQVQFFAQEVVPAFKISSGKVLMSGPDSLALSPNGHGGSLKALYTSGALADMQNQGVEQISYTQVDNPLVRVIDPLFIGLHCLDGAQMSSKMVTKANPQERVGVFCLVDGKVTVIEYSDLPVELAEQRLENGELQFGAGSIAIHMIRSDYVESLNRGTESGQFGLPFHRAEKKVSEYDPHAQVLIEPQAPNAVKLEMFVFDALPMCETSIVYQTDRLEEFAPIKNCNGPGVEDCLSTSQILQVERACRWLEAKGVTVPRDGNGHVNAVLEIRASTAVEQSDLDELVLPENIDPGSSVLV